ncbi:DUF5801 repeats-in-toxin domain-containing protein, partial [Sphingomicrobium astaxanthinifaciens]|uniref:DUF5801 repeats-in-toxin domain-containing protein n=1 Tax=Sphingomicrobium astaxanthinifaciens TaxID=1227949 RepID=UPI001FCCA3C4
MAEFDPILDPIVIDESEGLQTSGIPAAGEDNNDDDVLLATLMANAAALYDRLFSDYALSTVFATANGVAYQADFVTVDAADNETITDLFFAADAGGAQYDAWDGGVPAAGDLDSGLTTAGGEKIYLFRDTDAGLGSQLLLGVTESGNVAFAIYLDPAADNESADAWIVQFEAIDNGDDTLVDEPVDLAELVYVAGTQTSFFGFNDLPSGQNLFGIVGNPDKGVLVVGGDAQINPATTKYTNKSDTINTSQGGIDATIGNSNQMVDAGEAVFFAFINEPDLRYLAGYDDGMFLGLDQNEADFAKNMQYGTLNNVTGGSVLISQTQGNAKVALELSLYNVPDASDAVDGAALLPLLGQVQVALAMADVVVEDKDGNVVSGGRVTLSQVGDAVKIDGLKAGDLISWSGPAHDHVEILGKTGKFDIGGIGFDDPGSLNIEAGSKIVFEDDGPAPLLSLKGGVVLVDETSGENPGEDETATFGASATILTELFDFDPDNFGTDGPGASSWALTLNPLGTGNSGLKDSLTGQDVMLEQIHSLKVAGYIMIGLVKHTVFTVEIKLGTPGDPDDKVILDIHRAVWHPDKDDPDEAWDADPLLNKASTLVNGELDAWLTTTDAEGDSKSVRVDIGGILFFEDDAPSVALSLNDVDVVVDESIGENGAPETEPAGTLGQIKVLGSVLFDTSLASAGNDGEKSAVWSLKLTNGNGSSSGLKDTASGQFVYLYADGDDVVGRVGAGGLPDENGAIAFRVAIDSDDGDVTLTQYRALYHQDPDDHDENGSAGSQAPLAIAAGELEAVLEITDNDDDADSDSVDLGPALQFEDDGPAIGPVANGQIDFETGSSVSKSLGGDVGEDPNA